MVQGEVKRGDLKETQQLFDLAMVVTTQQAADKIFSRLVELAMDTEDDPEMAAQIVRTNLGYYAGYYDAETRERVERLFFCEHPIFGKIAEKGQPTPEEAFRMGVEWGEKHRRKHEQVSSEN